MNLHTLTAISPVDGRYYKQVQHLSAWFSEYALMKYRLHVEVEYFAMLAERGFFHFATARIDFAEKYGRSVFAR